MLAILLLTLAQPPAADAAADLYAPFPEEVLPADGHASAPLRPRKTDTVYKLSNPRIERGGPTPFPRLVVDYERVRDGTAGGVLQLVIRPAGKRDQTVRVGLPPRARAGKLEFSFRTGFPFAGDQAALQNCEYYLSVQDQSYGAGFWPTFKVSPSALVGEVKGGATFARNWTADETEKLRKPAPKWPNPNMNAGVGRDTPFAGDTSGNPPTFRYAEPGRPLLGLEWNVWNYGGEQRLSHLYPVYDREMPLKGHMPGVRQEVAKPGYAVGGLVVKAAKHAFAMQVVYLKLKPDGSLDPADRYTSDWLGNTEAAGAKDVTLGGDGRPVIGLTVVDWMGVQALSLVMSGSAKK